MKGPSPSPLVPACSSAAAQVSCEASTSGWRHSQLIPAAGGPRAAGGAAELGQANSAADGEQKVGELPGLACSAATYCMEGTEDPLMPPHLPGLAPYSSVTPFSALCFVHWRLWRDFLGLLFPNL